MITLADVWKCLAHLDTIPTQLPGAMLHEVCIAPHDGKTNRWLLVLPAESSPDMLDEALSRGAIGLVAEHRLPSAHPITWLDVTSAAGSDVVKPLEGPVGFVVPDVEIAIVELAKLWRTRTKAQIICLVGAEGLRTAQHVTQSVLSQRYKTRAPDILCCNAETTARALLAISAKTERLLLRMSLQDVEGLDFLKEVVRPHIISFTNMFPVHSASAAQNQLFSELFPGAVSPDTLLVANGDDPIIQTISAQIAATVFCYGLCARPSCALWTSHIESEGKEGLRLRMHYQHDTVHVRIALLGRYSVHTALAASAIGLISGQSWDEIVAGLRVMTTQLRLIMTPGINGAAFLEDSYAATPASTLSILNLLEGFAGRKIAVLGDMVEMDYLEMEGQKKVGTRVADIAAYLITVGRFGSTIAQEARSCGMPASSVYVAPDNQAATEKLRSMLAPGDIVLVCGARALGLKEIVDELVDTQALICEV